MTQSVIPTDVGIQNNEVGFVKGSKNFLTLVDGLPTVRINDLIQSESGARGWVSNLFSDHVQVLMLDEANVVPGQLFKRLPNRLTITASLSLLGRTINPLGVPVDGKGPISKSSPQTVLELEQTAPGIDSRQFITEQFLTGISLIDTLIPLAKGQRQLVMGDAHSGKTSFLIDLIVNQKNTGVICIYASIGKPSTTLRDLLDVLKVNKAMDNTIIISASSSEIAPLIFLAPSTALTLAEYFQKMGKDVLVILDDLGTHAKIYREISLLGNQPPGRESYPGDIFYQHAHLLERAGKFNKSAGAGSITALPVLELNLTDFTSFIPTNLMAMTDGHWLFKSSLHNLGLRPAIDIPLSVTRVGRQTQDRLSNLLSDKIRQLLSQAQELETISKFSSELPFQTRLVLNQKLLIEEALKHQPLQFIPKYIQLILLGLCLTTFLGSQDKQFFITHKAELLQRFSAESIVNLKSVDQLIKTLESSK